MTTGRPSKGDRARLTIRFSRGLVARVDSVPLRGDRNDKLERLVQLGIAIMSKQLFIENEGALFRGPAVGIPLEVWNPEHKAWYPFAGGMKPEGWGEVISPEQAEAFMAKHGKKAAE